MTIYHKTNAQLLDGIESAPNRVRTFLIEPEKGTTPHSCNRYHWNGDLTDLLTFCARALKGGSGIKITFPSDTQLTEPRPLGEWKVWIDEEAINNCVTSDYDHEFAFKVVDSMEGRGGILDSWRKLISCKNWDGLILDLTNLRPAGTVNANGLVASGAESFLAIYQGIAHYLETGTIESLIRLLGTLNSVMRRGGYKKGIITSAMSSECPLIYDYLAVPIVSVDGSHKKGVILHQSAFDNPLLIEAVVESRNTESTFIEKPCAEGLGWNVCVGLQLAHKATCLIWRINLGLCRIQDIRKAFRHTANHVCELHTTWRKKVPHLARYYAALEDDRQVGIDVMGLANLLAIEGVTYLEFADALDDLLNLDDFIDGSNLLDGCVKAKNVKALEIAFEIMMGYEEAMLECDEYMFYRELPQLDRIFTVEPAQNHAYDTIDRLGKTTCRGIFPPTGRVVTRTSDTQQNKRYFHGKVETDVQVGVALHERVCDLWQQMMDRTGRSHGISQDTWDAMTPTKLSEFMERPSQTLYYSEKDNFNQRSFLSKSVQKVTACDVTRKGECSACAD